MYTLAGPAVGKERQHVGSMLTVVRSHCWRLTCKHCVRIEICVTERLSTQVDISVAPGAHATEAAVNKQLADKERVAAALENPNLLAMVNRCLASADA